MAEHRSSSTSKEGRLSCSKTVPFSAPHIAGMMCLPPTSGKAASGRSSTATSRCLAASQCCGAGDPPARFSGSSPRTERWETHTHPRTHAHTPAHARTRSIQPRKSSESRIAPGSSCSTTTKGTSLWQDGSRRKGSIAPGGGAPSGSRAAARPACTHCTPSTPPCRRRSSPPAGPRRVSTEPPCSAGLPHPTAPISTEPLSPGSMPSTHTHLFDTSRAVLKEFAGGVAHLESVAELHTARADWMLGRPADHRVAERAPSRRRDCYSAAPPAPCSRCFNGDVEGASAK